MFGFFVIKDMQIILLYYPIFGPLYIFLLETRLVCNIYFKTMLVVQSWPRPVPENIPFLPKDGFLIYQ